MVVRVSYPHLRFIGIVTLNNTIHKVASAASLIQTGAEGIVSNLCLFFVFVLI